MIRASIRSSPLLVMSMLRITATLPSRLPSETALLVSLSLLVMHSTLTLQVSLPGVVMPRSTTVWWRSDMVLPMPMMSTRSSVTHGAQAGAIRATSRSRSLKVRPMAVSARCISGRITLSWPRTEKRYYTLKLTLYSN